MSAPSDGARADARKRLAAAADVEALSELQGVLVEWETTGESGEIVGSNADLYAQAEFIAASDWLAGVIADAKAEAWDEGWDVGRGIKEPACPDDHNPYRVVTS